MHRWILNALGLSAVGALLLCMWALYQVGSQEATLKATIEENRTDLRAAVSAGKNTAQKASQALPTAAQVASVASDAHNVLGAAQTALKDSSRNINRPCKGESGPDACGTLAQLNKTVIKAGDAIVNTQLEERAVLPHTTAAMDSLKASADHLTATEDAGTNVLNTVNDRLKDKAVKNTMDHLDTATGQLALISTDLHTWSHPILNPDPCKNAKCRFGRVMGTLGGYLDMGASAARVYEVFQPLKVQVVP